MKWPRENFSGYNKRSVHDSSREKVLDKNPKGISQSRESEMYQTVEITGCLRALFMFAPNPT